MPPNALPSHRYWIPAAAREALRAWRENCGWRRDTGYARTSTSTWMPDAAAERRRPRRYAHRGPRYGSGEPLGGRGCLGLRGFFLRALGLFVGRGDRLVLRTVEQRDQGERRVVALAEAHFQD